MSFPYFVYNRYFLNFLLLCELLTDLSHCSYIVFYIILGLFCVVSGYCLIIGYFSYIFYFVSCIILLFEYIVVYFSIFLITLYAIYSAVVLKGGMLKILLRFSFLYCFLKPIAYFNIFKCRPSSFDIILSWRIAIGAK